MLEYGYLKHSGYYACAKGTTARYLIGKLMYSPRANGLRILLTAHTDYLIIFALPKYHFFLYPSIATLKHTEFILNFTGLCVKVFSIYKSFFFILAYLYLIKNSNI
jgi:hypothetical protein